MSRRATASVAKAFPAAATHAYADLATEFGLEGPCEDHVVLATVTYSLEALEYKILHNPHDYSVQTQIALALPTATLTTPLGNLVRAANLGPAEQVKESAHTTAAMQRALKTQADFIRKLHPLLTRTPAAAEALMRRAGAREWPHRR